VMNWHEPAKKFCCKQAPHLPRNVLPFPSETER
jgi:hypothetical protein